MMNESVVIAGLVVILIIGTGVVWLNRQGGRFSWRVRNPLFGRLDAEAKGEIGANQLTDNSEKVTQESRAGYNSTQVAKNSKNISQKIK